MRQPQRHQGRGQRESPDQVVEEGLAAAPDGEEREPPAVLQHEAGQRDAQGQEGLLRGAVQQRGHADREQPGDQADAQRRPGAGGHCPAPGRDLGSAVADQQRVGGQPAGRVEHEPVGDVGQAERAELGRPQRPGHVDADREVRQAGDRLVGQTPAEPAAGLARQPGQQAGPGPLEHLRPPGTVGVSYQITVPGALCGGVIRPPRGLAARAGSGLAGRLVRGFRCHRAICAQAGPVAPGRAISAPRERSGHQAGGRGPRRTGASSRRGGRPTAAR